MIYSGTWDIIYNRNIILWTITVLQENEKAIINIRKMALLWFNLRTRLSIKYLKKLIIEMDISLAKDIRRKCEYEARMVR